MRKLARALLTCSLSSVALTSGAAPIDKAADPAKIGADLSLDRGSVGELATADCAVATPGVKAAIYLQCLYAEQADGALLIIYDEKENRFGIFRKLDPASLKGVALVKHGRARQLQIHEDRGMIVLSLLSKSRVWGDNPATNAAYDHLQKLGVQKAEPVQWVFNYLPIKGVRVQTH